MPLIVGDRLGPYEILASIGSGGMGDVYRARDTKLGRDVALKILPDAFAQDPDRLARFDREARTLAALNHPHIAQIYGLEEGRVGRVGQVGRVGEAESARAFLILELVEGPTLAELITSAALGSGRQALGSGLLASGHAKEPKAGSLKPEARRPTPVRALPLGEALSIAHRAELDRPVETVTRVSGMVSGRPARPAVSG